MAALRDPETGCPWDREQDFSSIAPYTLEEAYEVIDAIETRRLESLCAELGDLLFQVVYHAQMAKEQSLFDFDDVVAAISDKLIRRHPHVFADAVIESAAAQSRAWETEKRRERQAGKAYQSLLQGIDQALPALVRAQKLQQRAAGIGFDWPQAQDVLDKLQEELAELSAVMTNDNRASASERQQHMAEELGDMLFTCVNLARHLGIDAEAAARQANRKFERRFHYIETQLRTDGVSLEQAGQEQLERLWQAAKDEE